MDDYNKTVIYRFTQALNDHDISYLQLRLTSVEGIDSCDISSWSVSIDYNTLTISGAYIKELINYMGYIVKEEKKPGIFKRFVTILAKSNKKAFGNKKLDCCNMNQKTNKNEKNKTIGMLAVLTMIVLTACNKAEDSSVLSIEGIYVGTLKSGNGLKNASNSDVDAVAEVIITGNGQIEVHCYGDALDTTFMLNYYGNHDSVMVCLTGGDFEHMYGHMLGQGHMGGMMGDIANGETEWQHHMNDEHRHGDEHFGGFDMNTNNFSYTFKMANGYLYFNGHKK